MKNGDSTEFLSKIEPVPESGCWLWRLGCNHRGYGKVFIEGETVAAHRASYELFVGKIPEGLQVLHKCDVRSCVNPDHLFLGTQADNMIDAVKKGRTAKGEKQHLAKLTSSDARTIKRSTQSTKKLSKEYGVAPCTIRRVRNGATWRHV